MQYRVSTVRLGFYFLSKHGLVRYGALGTKRAWSSNLNGPMSLRLLNR